MPSFPPPLSQWKYRIPLTINGSLIDANLTDFPVLVKLNSSRFNFSKALSTGNDLRFALPDGTLLKYERERHDATNQVAEYWVKIPSILAGTNKVFYVYFGNPSASDGADPTNVWDSNFKGVWHFKETSGTVYDSTSNANNGSPYGDVNQNVDGRIGKCIQVNGNDDYINVPYSPSYDQLTQITVEGWIYPFSYPSDVAPMSGRDSQSYTRIWKIGLDDTQKMFYEIFGTGNGSFILSPSTYPLNQWYYLAMTFINGQIRRLYINGVEVHNLAVTGTLPQDTRVPLKIGNSGWSATENLNGKIDEFRISSIARSAAWIKASYHSGNDSLLIYGAEEKRSSIIPLII
jgi:biopolymer transport protein ExbB